MLEAQDQRLNNVSTDIQMLEDAFGDPNPATTAARQIETLQQGRR